MSEYYIPLEELPDYCCECPCSGEGLVYDMDTGEELYADIWCRITKDTVVSCAVKDLRPGWNAVPRPDNCPIVHWLW